MKRLFLLFFSICLLLVPVSVNAFSVDQTITVGPGGDAQNLNDAMNQIVSIPNIPSSVILEVLGNLAENSMISIPVDKNVRSLTIKTRKTSAVSIQMNGNMFCANGIPLTISANISVSNSFIFGGKCAMQNENADLNNTQLVIDGTVDTVYAGGMSYGNGSTSSVKDASLEITGTAGTVFLGGYAASGGNAVVTNQSTFTLSGNGNVSEYLYYGGYATGSGSKSAVNAVKVTSNGKAASVLKSGPQDNGGQSTLGTYDDGSASQIGSGVSIVPAPQIGSGAGGGSQVVQPGSGSNNPYPSQSAQITQMRVGPGEQYPNLGQAMASVPYGAGSVQICISSGYQEPGDVLVPSDRGIVSLTISSCDPSRKMGVTFGTENSFFANGVPFVLDYGVDFMQGYLYGGGDAEGGQSVMNDSTFLTINGTATKVIGGGKAKGNGSQITCNNTNLVINGHVMDWVYGGGSALYGGYSYIPGTVSVTINQTAKVDMSLASAGFAFGDGSLSRVTNVNASVSGTIIYAYFGGGYANIGGRTEVTGRTSMVLTPSGNIGQGVYYGGRAYAKSSDSVNEVWAQIQGKYRALHESGRAENTGSAVIGKIVR